LTLSFDLAATLAPSFDSAAHLTPSFNSADLLRHSAHLRRLPPVLRHPKYLVVCGLKCDAVNRFISDARAARVIAHTEIASTNNELVLLPAAAAAPELPADFSIPTSQIPALCAAAKVAHAAALVDAKRAHADAIQAELDAASTIRLHKNYCAYLTHDSDRTREELRGRTADQRFCRLPAAESR
jgi:hypothetical protein